MDRASACSAIDMIIEQGEAPSEDTTGGTIITDPLTHEVAELFNIPSTRCC